MKFEPDFDFEIPPTPQNLSMSTLPPHFQIKTFIPKIMDKSSSNKKKESIVKFKATFRLFIFPFIFFF